MLYNIVTRHQALMTLQYDLVKNQVSYSYINWVIHDLPVSSIVYIVDFWSHNPILRIICQWLYDRYVQLVLDKPQLYAQPCNNVDIDFIDGL